MGFLSGVFHFALGVSPLLLAFCSLMKRQALTALLALVVLAGCPKKGDPKTKAKGKDPTKDQSEDQTFQSFTGRLQTAVAKRDIEVLSALMAPGFGYRWDKAPEGETPFMYWDQHNLWVELHNLLKTKWVPYESFMVVPPELAVNDNYHGYRAGVRMINGAWRFAYFVPAPPAESPVPPLSTPGPDGLLQN